MLVWLMLNAAKLQLGAQHAVLQAVCWCGFCSKLRTATWRTACCPASRMLVWLMLNAAKLQLGAQHGVLQAACWCGCCSKLRIAAWRTACCPASRMLVWLLLKAAHCNLAHSMLSCKPHARTIAASTFSCSIAHKLCRKLHVAAAALLL
jgi:hypothetical protein